jgi:anti-sigma B factor antagonist
LNALKTFRATKRSTPTENIVSLSGELDLSVATELVEDLQPWINQQERALILDLQALQYIDSTGIGIIVSILKSRAAMKAPFVVRHIPPKIKRLFDLTGITKYLVSISTHKSEEGKEEIE